MVNGRSKGNKFENVACLTLSRWLDPRISPDAGVSALPFRRRSTSIMPIEGHWHGSGDILHHPRLDDLWPFCVECKCVEGWTLDSLFTNLGPLYLWWAQAERQARESGRQPLLLFSRNRQPIYAMLRQEDAACLTLPDVPQLRAHRCVVLLLSDLTQVDRKRLSRVSTPTKSRRPSSNGLAIVKPSSSPSSRPRKSGG